MGAFGQLAKCMRLIGQSIFISCNCTTTIKAAILSKSEHFQPAEIYLLARASRSRRSFLEAFFYAIEMAKLRQSATLMRRTPRLARHHAILSAQCARHMSFHRRCALSAIAPRSAVYIGRAGARTARCMMMPSRQDDEDIHYMMMPPASISAG